MVVTWQVDFREQMSEMLRSFSPPSSKRWWQDEGARTAAYQWICKALTAGKVEEARQLYWMLMELEQWWEEDAEKRLSSGIRDFLTDWLAEPPHAQSMGTRDELLELAEFVASTRWTVDQLVAQGDVPGMEAMERAAGVSKWPSSAYLFSLPFAYLSPLVPALTWP